MYWSLDIHYKMCFAGLCVLAWFRGPYANPGGWGQILAYMAFCEVSQEQTPGTDAYAGDFGFKVLTAADPAEKTKKLNAEIANGRLAMMAIIGMFFQAGIGAVRVLFVPTHQEQKYHKESEKGSTTLCDSAWCVLSF